VVEEEWLAGLHPRLADWFRASFSSPTEAQLGCVPHVVEGRSVLLSSPTGSGKTLAGFLGVLHHLMSEVDAGTLHEPGVRAVYVSPLRALTYDMEKNLSRPLRELGLEGVITVGLRTGDTTAAERTKMRRKPPHILLTTPESLAILLPQESWKSALARLRFVIVDELHAIAENKRGPHLALSLERLEARQRLVRVGLSATAAPLDRLAELLCGVGRPCEIVQANSPRKRRVEVLSPLKKDPYPASGWTAARVLNDIARVVEQKQSVIIFCNTRGTTESLSLRLKGVLPKLADQIEAHHSSLDREVRQEVEDRLKMGQLRAVVCSTSLELGIDIGAVDGVIMISTPKGISRALQRIGRSGHSVHEDSHGILVATNINDLMECAVCAEMTRRNQLDEVRLMDSPLDVLAQHLVGMAAEGNWTKPAALETVRRAAPFAALDETEFERVLRYLAGGGSSLERQYADTFGKVKVKEDTGMLEVVSQRVVRDYLVNVGTIHSDGMVNVVLGRRRLGQVEEGFAKGLKVGDIFVLGGRTLRFLESGMSEIYVQEARGLLPSVPSWNANKMPLSSGLCHEVTTLRTQMAERLAAQESRSEVADWLVEHYHLSLSNAAAIVRHCCNQERVSLIPRRGLLLIERFQEERSDLIHFFFHSLIGRSANNALSRIVAHRLKLAAGGNALVTLDDYGFMLTVKDFQDLELEAWKELFAPEDATTNLRAALDESDLVRWQFRGVAQTALMVPRQHPGQQRKLKQLRFSADILFNVLRDHEPDHPVLTQAVKEATHTFLDTDRAVEFLRESEVLRWELIRVPVVSPFSFGIYASKIRESLMLEQPEEAIERLWRDFERRFPEPTSEPA
jgi:ATP-dependent helicase Lhr and Lhr-like helicase